MFKKIHLDSKGNPSWTRVTSTLCLLVAVALTAYQGISGTDQFSLISLWLGSAMGSKAIQNFTLDLNSKKRGSDE